MMQYYKQCTLCKQDHTWQIVFLPVELAQVGKTVIVDGDPDKWVVFSVAPVMVNEVTLDSWRKQWKSFEQVLS